MTKVFIGGSRRITKLNKDITKKLDDFIQNGFTILVGDANGADKSVQSYLNYRNYENVIVFCMENKCRNNIGNWLIKSTETNLKDKSFDYYSTKDLGMVKETDHAFMIWDTKSKGTLNNILNLVKEGKTVLVHLSPEKRTYRVRSSSGLKKLLAKCDQEFPDKNKKVTKPYSIQRHLEANPPPIKSGSHIGTVRQRYLPVKKHTILQGSLPLDTDGKKNL